MAAIWTITSTQYDIKGSKGDNQITKLHWECTDKDGDHSGRVYGSTAIPEPSGTFIEYAKVTEEQAKKWLLAVIGDDQVKAYEDSVANQIALSKTPKRGSGKPW
tara:strand:+ start:213 stop:524 length:312 start_codon:yes stop_codon:yes gene_type:complete